MNDETRYRIPSEKVLEQIYTLPVQDENKKKMPFKDLITGAKDGEHRNIVIFVRHFFCGVGPPSLANLSSNLTKLPYRCARNTFVQWQRHRLYDQKLLQP